jgi:hypothetical protein
MIGDCRLPIEKGARCVPLPIVNGELVIPGFHCRVSIAD